MKPTAIIILILLNACIALADSRDEARKELFELLDHRKELFDNYDASLKKKSGFFGNRTKNDMKQSQTTLQDIVGIDNKIMNSLNRVIDVKNYEKTSMTFDVGSYQDRINSLTKVNDVTLAQNESLTAENKSLKSEMLKMKFYLFILLLIIAILLFVLFKSKKRVGV